MGEHEKQEVSATTLWITWGALFMSLIIYMVVLFIITGNPENAPEPDPELISTLRIAFGGVAVAEIIGLFVARKAMFFDKLSGDNAFASLEKMRGTYMTTCILSWALAESVAIYGFVLSFLSYELIYYEVFFVPAAVLYIAFRPQLGKVEKRYLENQISENAEVAKGGPDTTDEAGIDTVTDDDSVW